MKFQRKIFRKILCGILSLSLIIGGAQLPVSAKEMTVSDEAEFMAALADPSVETIVLTDEIMISRSADGLDNAFVIHRPVTIQGGGLRVERAGIVLGGSVTFQDTSIYLANPVRNAIIANGYSLTMSNVTDGGSPYVIHLFAGGITDYTGGNLEEIPMMGTGGDIRIRGANDLANIYAGSLSDVSAGAEEQANEFGGTADIFIENGASGFGEIFAHGAKEDRSGGQANAMIADESFYEVSGEVCIYLESHKTVTIHGATGSEQNANFIYTDNGKGYVCTPTLKNIGNIFLNPSEGGSKANLQPTAASSLSEKGAKLYVPKDTILNLTNLGAEVEIDELNGGGTIVLEESQKLCIEGNVQGKTTVAIGDINFYGDASTGYPEEGEIYIQAEQSTKDSFVLLPPAYDSTMILKKDSAGNWKTEAPTYRTIIEQVSMENMSLEAENYGVSIPVAVRYASDGFDYLSYVPMKITVNGLETDMSGDEIYGYFYATGDMEHDLELYFYEDEEGVETLNIYGVGNANGIIPEGVYELRFDIPEEHMKNEETYSFEITLTVGEPSVTPTEIPEVTPTATPEATPTATPDAKEDVTQVFTDVYMDWYMDYVQYVYDRQLMTGIKGTTKFEPNANITKAQVAQVLYNMLDEKPAKKNHQVFRELKDVYAGEWYAEAVSWAYDSGVVTGDLNTKKFQPNADVTREQLALMIFRFAKSQGYNTEQTSALDGLLHAELVAEWSAAGVKWAVGTGLISGIEMDGVKDLAPQGTATRAQVAAILMRFCENYRNNKMN